MSLPSFSRSNERQYSQNIDLVIEIDQAKREVDFYERTLQEKRQKLEALLECWKNEIAKSGDQEHQPTSNARKPHRSYLIQLPTESDLSEGPSSRTTSRTTEHIQQPFKCSECSSRFATAHNLRRHRKIHDSKNSERFTCPYSLCARSQFNSGFRRRDNLTAHLRLVHNEQFPEKHLLEPLVPPDSRLAQAEGQEFRSEEHTMNLGVGDRETASHSEGCLEKEALLIPLTRASHVSDPPETSSSARYPPIELVIDGSKSPDLHSSPDLTLSHGPENSSSSVTMSDPEVDYGCFRATEQQSSSHEQQHPGSIKLLGLATRVSMDRHESNGRGTYSRSSTPHGRRHICDFPGCGKEFLYESKLRDHAHSHARDKRHVCEKCSKSFKRPRELQAHRKTHKAILERQMITRPLIEPLANASVNQSSNGSGQLG